MANFDVLSFNIFKYGRNCVIIFQEVPDLLMKLSITWLEKFLSLDEITPEEVAHKLTMGAFEVEEIQKTGPKLQGPIVTGKILEIQKHPNADRLSVTKVTTDKKNELVVVCGAKNIQVGQIVPVSLAGAVVINRQDGSELAIKTSEIRGIKSFGMLCSPGELGLAAPDQNGIFIFPEETKLGENVIDYLSLNQETVLEVASRSNRGDALSVYGLSKEISALSRKKLKEITFSEPKTNKSVQNVLPKIENTKDTFLFYTATIENITICESPRWLKRLLEAVGIRPINNIVDITNYINFTFGQPMHAYDRAKLKGKTLTSRAVRKGEKILTLDGKLRDLKEGILVIADENSPVALAGIMGGKDTEVSQNTKDIVLEAAVFSPHKVRKGSRTVGLTTEASKRFERGVDSVFTYKALLKAIELLEELASTNNNKPKVGEIQQAGEVQSKEIKIQLNTNEVKRVIGIDLKGKEIAKLLKSLEFKCKLIPDNKLEVIVPSFRTNDVTRQIDLIEEIARFYSYDQIPQEPPPVTIAAKKSYKVIENIKNYFLGCGFSETYLSSLVGEQILSSGDFPYDSSSSVAVLNPLSKEHSSLRQCLIPGLLEALKLNQSHQIKLIKLFEIGKTYFFDKNKTLKEKEKETGVVEKYKLACIIAGHEELKSLFFTAKGLLEGFFNKYNCQASFNLTEESFLHPNFALKITLNNNDIGIFGSLHPQVEKKLELHGPVILFEITLEPLLAIIEKTKIFEKISSMPIVERDITIDLSKKHLANEVTSEIKKVISSIVIGVNLISVYELDNENRSLTYRLKMQDFEQTLTSKQVEDEVNSIKNHLSSCLQAKFRV